MTRIICGIFYLLFSMHQLVYAAEKPEIFVQTGHIDSVKIVAINPAGTCLITMDDGFPTYLKIWDTSTGRELRTVNLKINVQRILFIDNNSFTVYYPDSVETLDMYGNVIKKLNFPKLKHIFEPVLSKNGQYLFDYLIGDGTKIYSMADGSEVFLPELKKNERSNLYHYGVADLGYGYYGIFLKGRTSNGNVDYLIYDDSLNLRLSGSLTIPGISFNNTFRVSPDLKQIACQGVSPPGASIQVYNLATKEQLLAYTPRPLAKKGAGFLGDEYLYFGFTPDSRIWVEYDQWKDKPQHSLQAKTSVTMELVVITPVKNGIYTEKKMLLDNLSADLQFGKFRPYVITGNRAMIAGFNNGTVRMLDLNTGAEIKRFGVKPTSLFYSSRITDDNLLLYYEDASSTKPTYELTFTLWNLADASLKMLNVETKTGAYQKHKYISSINYTQSITCSSDPEMLYRKIPSHFFLNDYKKIEQYGCNQSLIFIAKDTGAFSVNKEQNRQVLIHKKTKQKVADLYAFEDGEWIVITPDGYYNASPNGDKNLNVRVGKNVYGIENYRETFFRPDLVKLALAGGSLQGYRNLADVKQPPKVSIVQTPVTAATESLKLTLKLEEQGGGFGDVRLFLNGSAVMLDSSRSLKAVQKDGSGAVFRNYTLKLSPGSNTIRAVAFNADNSMQSNEAVHQVTASFTANHKPTLHALVIGINDYKNPKLTLQYAVADAQLFADTLKKSASGLFDKVIIKTLTTRAATTAENIAHELKVLRTLNPDDLFVLYVASHGVVDDGEYYLITSNVGLTRTEKLKTDALTQTALKELIANIPTTKKLIILDTCNASAAGDAIQLAMLTRGMSEDAAVKILSRAVGSTILSAATSSQEALEGYQGHGLFTWVLTEGLRGKADKGKSGYIKTTDIADYVGEEVPNLAEKVFKRAQYPTISMSGQPFPVGKVR